MEFSKTKKGEKIITKITSDDVWMNGVLKIPDDCVGIASNSMDYYVKDDIVKVILPDSMQKIARGVFEDCGELREVVGGNLKQIGAAAFKNTSLRKIDLSKATLVAFNAFDKTYINESNNPDIKINRTSKGTVVTLEELKITDKRANLKLSEFDVNYLVIDVSSDEILKKVLEEASRMPRKLKILNPFRCNLELNGSDKIKGSNLQEIITPYGRVKINNKPFSIDASKEGIIFVTTKGEYRNDRPIVLSNSSEQVKYYKDLIKKGYINSFEEYKSEDLIEFEVADFLEAADKWQQANLDLGTDIIPNTYMFYEIAKTNDVKTFIESSQDFYDSIGVSTGMYRTLALLKIAYNVGLFSKDNALKSQAKQYINSIKSKDTDTLWNMSEGLKYGGEINEKAAADFMRISKTEMSDKMRDMLAEEKIFDVKYEVGAFFNNYDKFVQYAKGVKNGNKIANLIPTPELSYFEVSNYFVDQNRQKAQKYLDFANAHCIALTLEELYDLKEIAIVGSGAADPFYGYPNIEKIQKLMEEQQLKSTRANISGDNNTPTTPPTLPQTKII
ncbi:MAG: leucine-rich repeat domain-containing protein [Clostridiales bacterium]|jgi:hypothetical protein|nr:leucine-rich repeat domain-containing protein [Clostridiales bacterium]